MENKCTLRSKHLRLLVYQFLHFKKEVLAKIMVLSKAERDLIVSTCQRSREKVDSVCKREVKRNIGSDKNIREEKIEELANDQIFPSKARVFRLLYFSESMILELANWRSLKIGKTVEPCFELARSGDIFTAPQKPSKNFFHDILALAESVDLVLTDRSDFEKTLRLVQQIIASSAEQHPAAEPRKAKKINLRFLTEASVKLTRLVRLGYADKKSTPKDEMLDLVFTSHTTVNFQIAIQVLGTLLNTQTVARVVDGEKGGRIGLASGPSSLFQLRFADRGTPAKALSTLLIGTLQLSQILSKMLQDNTPEEKFSALYSLMNVSSSIVIEDAADILLQYSSRILPVETPTSAAIVKQSMSILCRSFSVSVQGNPTGKYKKNAFLFPKVRSIHVFAQQNREHIQKRHYDSIADEIEALCYPNFPLLFDLARVTKWVDSSHGMELTRQAMLLTRPEIFSPEISQGSSASAAYCQIVQGLYSKTKVLRIFKNLLSLEINSLLEAPKSLGEDIEEEDCCCFHPYDTASHTKVCVQQRVSWVNQTDHYSRLFAFLRDCKAMDKGVEGKKDSSPFAEVSVHLDLGLAPRFSSNGEIFLSDILSWASLSMATQICQVWIPGELVVDVNPRTIKGFDSLSMEPGMEISYNFHHGFALSEDVQSALGNEWMVLSSKEKFGGNPLKYKFVKQVRQRPKDPKDGEEQGMLLNKHRVTLLLEHIFTGRVLKISFYAYGDARYALKVY